MANPFVARLTIEKGATAVGQPHQFRRADNGGAGALYRRGHGVRVVGPSR